MSLKEVTAQRQNGEPITVSYDIPDTLEEMVSRFTPEVVLSHTQRSVVVALQSFVRTQLDRSKTPDEITTAVAEWKPGQKKVGKSPADKIGELFGKMTVEERNKLLREYNAKEKRERAGQPANAQA